MWLAVIISVCLAVEIFSYLTGEEMPINTSEDGSEA